MLMFKCLKRQKTYTHESVSGWSEVELSAESYIDGLKSDIRSLKNKVDSLTDDIYENTPEYRILFDPVRPTYIPISDHSDFQVQKRLARGDNGNFQLRSLYAPVKAFSTREEAEEGLIAIKEEYSKNQ